MGKKSSMTSDPSSSQNPKKSQKKSKTSNPKHSESVMDPKPEDPKHSPIPISFPASPKSPRPATANPPKSSKLATPGKKARAVDEDSILIMEKVIEFMSGNGGKTPTESTIKQAFEHINSFLTRKLITSTQLYNRIRNLKKKYYRLIENKVDIDSPDLSTFVDLGDKIWGRANGTNVKRNTANRNTVNANGSKVGNGSKSTKMTLEEDENSEKNKGKKQRVEKSDEDDTDNDKDGFMFDDAKNRDMFPILFEQAKRAWEQNGYSIDDLNKGFEFIDKSKCKELQKKWQELVVGDIEMELQKLKNNIGIRNMVSKLI